MEHLVKKMREIAIFRNKTPLNESKTLVLHQDDMQTYNSWLLVNCHFIDKVIYRGKSSEAPSNIENLKRALSKIGNPKNIIITYSTQDTY